MIALPSLSPQLIEEALRAGALGYSTSSRHDEGQGGGPYGL